MGGRQSILNQERLNEYLELTYLTKSEILHILKQFEQLNDGVIRRDFNHRFSQIQITYLFPELKYNPFCDQIFHVFSSRKDDKLSFEDFLDVYSALSENCPFDVKATWVFKILDFNDDRQIDKSDICEIIDRLTTPFILFPNEKDYICDVLLETMGLQHTGSMSQLEFLHSMKKMPEFMSIFSFKI